MARQAVMCAPVRAAAGPLSPLAIICALAPAGVAQLVEQRIRNAKVDSSSPSIGTIASFIAMTAAEQSLIDKIKQLPPQRMAEVEDFVDFLRTREDEQRLTRAATKVSEASFASVWDNDEDAAYDRM
jgi:hypothetical protein